MITISLCMIVRDEEANLRRCLDSVRAIVDEIVIVDTGSTDRTREIARAYTARVYDFAWQDDFSAARNFSFSKATMDYCLWLDADDVFEPEDAARLHALKQSLHPDTDIVMLRYHTAFDAQGKPVFTYYRERLIRRAAGFLWQGAVHEAIAPAGTVVYADAAVTHRKTAPRDPDRNLRILETRMAQGLALSPREQFYYARELLDHGRDADAAAVLKAFLEDGAGWLENKLEACRDLAQCYRRLGQPDEALGALLSALRYGPPRAELCCDLGALFLERAEYGTAAFWYELALTCTRADETCGFVVPDCYGFIPCMQLCVCYYWLGDLERAADYNNRAGAFKPDDPAYLYNLSFFAAQADSP